MTQPAVTQHIQYLEDKYGRKLVTYENRTFSLTPAGEELRDLLARIAADAKHFQRRMDDGRSDRDDVYFGATLSIGEYLMPNVIAELLQADPRLNIHMEVDNSKVLLEKLQAGELEFALIEGIIDKSKYHSVVFSVEEFIPVCAQDSVFAQGPVRFGDLFGTTLVLREEGSGTREIFELILKEHNYSVDSFQNIIEIGNMAAIKKLVGRNLGITFLYSTVAEEELKLGKLSKIDIVGFEAKREFNFVFLKDSAYTDKYLYYLHMMQEAATRVCSDTPVW
jgi:DNA-binding transcriptional LysR family regulator